MTRKEQLEKKQAEAVEAAKKARKELAKIERAEKRKAAQEAREKEQAHALAFLAYCKGYDLVWESGKETEWHESVYDWMLRMAKKRGIDLGGSR